MTTLIQKKVVDRNERRVGKLEDVIIDLNHAQVPFTLVSVGGGDQLTLLPAENYAYLSKPKLVLSVDRKAVQGAPQVPRTNPVGSLTPGTVRDAWTHFSPKSPETFRQDLGQMHCGSALVGAALLGKDQELLGHIRDVMVDLPLGRAVYLVVEPVPGLGQEKLLYVVPPLSVQADVAGATLLLTTDRAHFLAGPHFQTEFWTDMAFPELAAAVRKHYNLTPSSVSRLYAASEPALGKFSSEVTTEAPSGRSDQQITRAILEEIVHDAAGFFTVSISVNTVKGKVTLIGKVRSEKQKKQIILAAERIAGSGNVNDQLEIGAKAKTAQL